MCFRTKTFDFHSYRKENTAAAASSRFFRLQVSLFYCVLRRHYLQVSFHFEMFIPDWRSGAYLLFNTGAILKCKCDRIVKLAIIKGKVHLISSHR